MRRATRTRRSRPASIVAATTMLLSACTGSDSTRSWTEPWSAPVDLTTVERSDRTFSSPSDDPRVQVEPIIDQAGEPCLHLGAVSSIDDVTAVRTFHCFPSVENGAGSSAAIGTDDVKVIWIQGGADTARLRFWSNQRAGLSYTPYAHESQRFIFLLMTRGEEPWGYQRLDAEGRLIASGSFVGLGPG